MNIYIPVDALAKVSAVANFIMAFIVFLGVMISETKKGGNKLYVCWAVLWLIVAIVLVIYVFNT